MRDIDERVHGGGAMGDGQRGLIVEGCCLLRSRGWICKVCSAQYRARLSG